MKLWGSYPTPSKYTREEVYVLHVPEGAVGWVPEEHTLEI